LTLHLKISLLAELRILSGGLFQTASAGCLKPQVQYQQHLQSTNIKKIEESQMDVIAIPVAETTLVAKTRHLEAETQNFDN